MSAWLLLYTIHYSYDLQYDDPIRLAMMEKLGFTKVEVAASFKVNTHDCSP